MHKNQEGIPRYRRTTSEIKIDGKNYTTYGIAGDSIAVEDVSTDPEVVDRIVREINKAELQECHLLEVIEDFLTQNN